MNNFDAADKLVREFSNLHGIEVSFSETAICGLMLDEKFHITLRFEPDFDALLMHASIGALPTKDKSAYTDLLLEILAANYLWRGAAGATLSLALDVLTVQQLLPVVNLTVEDFEEQLFKLGQTVSTWQQRLENFNSLESTTSSDRPNMIKYG